MASSELVPKLLTVVVVVCSVLVTAAYGETTTTLRNLPVVSFDEGYAHLFGEDNLMVLRDGKSVHLSLDERTGSGFVSHDLYHHGFFSASIKLPADYTAGVVVAFYMSNGDMYEKSHDEIDFEFLGNIRGKDWRIQTNVYGNGSTDVGREERYGLWFDPSDEFHQYSILWTQDHIIFYVDDTPIREFKRTDQMILTGAGFPTKPMSLYATIWDGSGWATNGGKYRVNYKYAPYVAEFSDLTLHGCASDPTDHSSLKCENEDDELLPEGSEVPAAPASLTAAQRGRMAGFRKNHMMYSYCYDRRRYAAPPSECVVDRREAERLRRFDPVTFGGGRRRRGGKRRGGGGRKSAAAAAAM